MATLGANARAIVAQADGNNGWCLEWLLLAAGLGVLPQAPMFFLCPSFCFPSLGLLWPQGEMDFAHREDTQEIGPSDIYKSDLIPALGSLPGPAGPRSCANSSGFWRAGLAQFPASWRPLTLYTRPVDRANSSLFPPTSRPCPCCSGMPSSQHPHPLQSSNSLIPPPGSLFRKESWVIHPAACW